MTTEDIFAEIMVSYILHYTSLLSFTNTFLFEFHRLYFRTKRILSLYR